MNLFNNPILQLKQGIQIINLLVKDKLLTLSISRIPIKRFRFLCNNQTLFLQFSDMIPR